MPGIEASPGCGRFRIPGLGINPVWSCAARGDGVSARRHDTGLPVGLSLLRPGERSRLPRLVSSASRASIRKFLDFSIAASLRRRAESYKTNLELWGCAPVPCVKAQTAKPQRVTNSCVPDLLTKVQVGRINAIYMLLIHHEFVSRKHSSRLNYWDSHAHPSIYFLKV